jgi:hypothetical protein
MALPPLYKYLDIRGAKLTLDNKTFKHSKPADFNDIEDLKIQSIFPEDVETALTKLAENVVDIIVNATEAPINPKVALLRAIYRRNPKAADDAREQIKTNPLEWAWKSTACALVASYLSRRQTSLCLAHSTAKCNGESFGVEENLTRSSVAEYLSGARVEFILDLLDIGI